MSAASMDITVFRDLVSGLLGFDFDDSKIPQLEAALRQRIAEAGFDSAAAYLSSLHARPGRDEIGALAELLTVGETFFFRNAAQFQALTEVVLPDRERARNGAGDIRILSAGCASGEEAFTLAIVAREAAGRGMTRPARVLAVDINPAALRRASQARYSEWSFRECPAGVRERYFHPSGRDYLLDKTIHDAVRFEQANLIEDDARIWSPGVYDVVFCRNVLMYLKTATAQDVVARISRSLVPGGYLFLGHAETLRGISQDFHLRHTHGTFYYQRRSGEATAGDSVPRRDEIRAASAEDTASTLVENAETWMEAIRAASERIAGLAGGTAGAGPPETAATAPSSMAAVLDLMGHEKFGEALQALGSGAPTGGEDQDARLLQAAIQVNAGNAREAERLCAAVLAADDLNAGARYVMALCRETAGDPGGAEEHDRAAAYLDPSFAMPRIHLGFLRRKSGDLAAARVEFERALALLPGEDASRILVLGGGFGREALMRLCRAEIRLCEGRKA